MQVPQRTSLLRLFKQPKSMTAAIIAIALIAGGGTSYAAEGAVPGDFLYTVKTEINENVKSAFAFSNESEAELQAELAEKRLQEAETLAARGELNGDVSAMLGAQIKNHYDEAMVRSAAAEAEGNYDVSASVRASLEGSFRTHGTVLADLNTTIFGNNSNELITEIRAYADEAADVQERASTSMETSVGVGTKAVAEATVIAAERLIAQVQIELADARFSVKEEAHTRAEMRLAQATGVHAEAQAALEAEAYAEAYTSAQTALRIAREVDSMVNSMLRLDIDLNLDTAGDIDLGTDENNDRSTSDDQNQMDMNEDNMPLDIDATLDANIDTDAIDLDVRGGGSIGSDLGL